MYDPAVDSTSKMMKEMEIDKENRVNQAAEGTGGHRDGYKLWRIPLLRSSGCTLPSKLVTGYPIRPSTSESQP